jgi:peroxygenase
MTAKLSPLQKHVAFFDQNKDGTIEVKETQKGLNRLGVEGAKGWVAARAIHLGLGFGNEDLKMSIKDIAQSKHEGDSGVFTAEGDVDKAKFNEMFAKYDTNNSGSMTSEEFANMRAERAKTLFGRIAGRGEFNLLVSVAADGMENGAESISRQRMEAFYDGTLFDQIAAERGGKK